MPTSPLWVTFLLFYTLLHRAEGATNSVLSVQKTLDLNPIDIKTVVIDPVATDQIIEVKAKAEHGFDLHVYLLADEEAIEVELAKNRDHEKLIAGSRNQKTHQLTATIPAKAEGVVRVACAEGKSVSVSLSITQK